jgi:hypothetical protein
MRLRTVSVLVLAGLFTVARADRARKLKELTGKDHVKVVWSRSESNVFGFPPMTGGEDQKLMGFDTETGTTHTILEKTSNYQRPMLTRDGRHVVYSHINDEKVYIVDWKGEQAPVELADGLAGCLWYDEALDKEYVIYAYECGPTGTCEIHKLSLDGSGEDVCVFNKGIIENRNDGGEETTSGHFLCMSRDGKVIGGLWGWPTVSFYNIESGNIVKSTDGCWPSLPYDNTYRLLVFTGDHTALRVFDTPGAQATTIPTGRCEHPRLASYSTDILCLTRGMQEEGGKSGGYVQVIKLDPNLEKMIDSVNVTSVVQDGFPDLWSGDFTSGAISRNRQARYHSAVFSGQTSLYDIRGRRLRNTGAGHTRHSDGAYLEMNQGEDGDRRIRIRMEKQQ